MVLVVLHEVGYEGGNVEQPGHGKSSRMASTSGENEVFRDAFGAQIVVVVARHVSGQAFRRPREVEQNLADRPASGGPNLKHKFVETASFIVGKINPQRSVSLLLFAGDKIQAAGNVTIPPNHEIPQTGQVVECRYLHAFPESGSIYQPVFLGTREDIPAEECTTAQLKYRAEPAEAAA